MKERHSRHRHGPFEAEKLGSGRARRAKKMELWEAAREKRCVCELCEENGQRGVTERSRWFCPPTDAGLPGHEVYITDMAMAWRGGPQ